MSDILVLQVVVIACGTSAFIASLQFLRRWLELKAKRPDTIAGDGGLHARLETIEQIVATTAIEVERLSEANRFMARLLAERTGVADTAPRPEPRVITPH